MKKDSHKTKAKMPDFDWVNWTNWTPFLKLATRRKFTTIEKIIENGDAAAVRKWLRKEDPKTTTQAYQRQNALHVILEFRPPLDLVEKLISVQGNSLVPEDVVDARGKTPLHIAAAVGCNSAVIRRLTHGKECYLSAVRTMDRMERSPLHWACAGSIRSCCVIFGNDARNMVETVSILLRAFPEAVRMRDIFGMTPMDLAMDNQQANDQILQLLEDGYTEQTEQGTSFDSGTSTASWLIPDDIPASWSDDLSSLGNGGANTLCHRTQPGIKRRKYRRMVYEI